MVMNAYVTERPFLTIREVAERLAVSESTVRRAICRGELEALQLRPCGAVRVPVAALKPREQA
jgi:excisionase family DNA binding protein